MVSPFDTQELQDFNKNLPKENIEAKKMINQERGEDKKADAYLAAALNKVITRLYRVFNSDGLSRLSLNKEKDRHTEYLKEIKKKIKNESEKNNLSSNKLSNYLLSSRLQDLKNEIINLTEFDNKITLLEKINEILSGSYSHQSFLLIYIKIIDKIRLYLNHYKIQDTAEAESRKLEISLSEVDIRFLENLVNLARTHNNSSLDLNIGKYLNHFPEALKTNSDKVSLRKIILFFISFTLKQSELNHLLDRTSGLKDTSKDDANNHRLVLNYFCKRDKRKDFYNESTYLEDILKSYSWLYSLPNSYKHCFSEQDINLINKNFQELRNELVVSDNTEDTDSENNLNHLWRLNQDAAFSLFLSFWNMGRVKKKYSLKETKNSLILEKMAALGNFKLEFALDTVLTKTRKTKEGLPLEPELKKIFIFKDTLEKDEFYPFKENTFHDKERSVIENRVSKNRLYLSQNNAFFRIILVGENDDRDKLSVNFRISKAKLISLMSQVIKDGSVNESLIEDFIGHCLKIAFDDKYLAKELAPKGNLAVEDRGLYIASLEKLKRKSEKPLDEKMLSNIKHRKEMSKRILDKTEQATREGRNISKPCIDYVIGVINSYLDESSLKALKQELAKDKSRKEKIGAKFRKISSRKDFDKIREQLIYFRRKENQEGFIESLRKANPELIAYSSNIDSLDKLIESLDKAYIKFLSSIEANLSNYSEEEKAYLASHRLGLGKGSIYQIQNDDADKQDAYIKAMRKIQFPRELELNTTSERIKAVYEADEERYKYFESVKDIYQMIIKDKKNIHDLINKLKEHLKNHQQPVRFSGCLSVNRIAEFSEKEDSESEKIDKDARLENVKSSVEADLQSIYPILKDIKFNLPKKQQSEKINDKEIRLIKQDLYLDSFVKDYIYFLLQKISKNESSENIFYKDEIEDKNKNKDKRLEVSISFLSTDGKKFPLNGLKPVMKFTFKNGSLDLRLDSLNTLLVLVKHYRTKDLAYVLFKLAASKGNKELSYNEIKDKFDEYYIQLDQYLSKILELETKIYDLNYYFQDLTFLENNSQPKTGFKPYADWLETRINEKYSGNSSDKEKVLKSTQIISNLRNSCCHDAIADFILSENIDSSFADLEWFIDMVESKCSAKPN